MPHDNRPFLFLTSFNYPTSHAHPTHGLEMARAWASVLGRSFTFVVGSAGDERLLHGIKFRRAFGAFGRVIQTLHLRTPAYFLWLFLYLLRTRNARVFVNDVRLATGAAMLRKLFAFTLIFESHGIYSGAAEGLIYSAADKVVFVTDALRTRAIGNMPSLVARSVVLQNAVDVSRYDSITSSKETLRTGLKLPSGPLIGYIGRFKPGGIDKGVGFMLRALPQLPQEYRMLFVGGTESEIREMEASAEKSGIRARVIFVPFVPAELVPKYCKACDVLAYVPNDTDSDFHQIETSPMKLFEYMAAQRPIVVSDTPATREVLDESSAFFCIPGSVESFAGALVATQKAETVIKVKGAYAKVRSNTWHNRATAIASL